MTYEEIKSLTKGQMVYYKGSYVLKLEKGYLNGVKKLNCKHGWHMYLGTIDGRTKWYGKELLTMFVEEKIFTRALILTEIGVVGVKTNFLSMAAAESKGKI